MRTSGHQRLTRSTIELRNRRTIAKAATLSTSSASRIQRTVLQPDGADRSRSSEIDASVTINSTPSRTPCTAVLANESIAPDATAVGADNPCRRKKRMLTAMRARFDGSATFM